MASSDGFVLQRLLLMVYVSGVKGLSGFFF
ncbi:hypothetical protein Cyrtocomes_00123 [Candidatus Cyrtobacter comes]|uniref:Uncharacterized protein n=1 Tax=Candidatus Cyrtobacter comes TaxID=675776 RepID=A0ABU5L796_9RICK|nr:hypothetical protein [Candidatus Cyrtobacter comes]